MQLTVYFDGQYWVGVAEDTDYDPPRVARHIFGVEPHDAEIADFVNRRMFALLAETPLHSPADAPQSATGRRQKPHNPKRRAREAAVAVRESGVSTRAQLALQQQYEAHKRERRTEAREQREAELARKWELKRARAKERHRGH